MNRIDPRNIPVPKVQQILQGAIAPRPIALASTVDQNGKPNLSPFSFFNVFGVNPTTLIFSPSRRGRDNTTKHTFENLKEVPEVVINVVTYSIVEQVSLASTEYPKGINEFEKAGLTPLPSELVKPARVLESPVQFECKVRQIIETGYEGGAGILVICEILLIHLDPTILDNFGGIDPHKIDLVGRMGMDFYCRASGEAIFTVKKPLLKQGIGIDQLPVKIKSSPLLSGNDLGRLGNIESLPAEQEIERFKLTNNDLNEFFSNLPEAERRNKAVDLARKKLQDQDTEEAMKILMAYL